MKISALFEHRRIPLPRQIETLIPQVLAAAQGVYDDWDENPDEYAGGGICHLMADAVADVFNSHDIEATTQSAEQGEQHVWAVVLIRTPYDDGDETIAVYEVDIPPGVYETGSGYAWKKIPDVKFDRNDLVIVPICHGRRCVDDYFGDY